MKRPKPRAMTKLLPYEKKPMGHVWKKNDYNGRTDIFGYSEGHYHNGPVCVRCGYGFCHHCREMPAKACARAAKGKRNG